jgi:hypothetical protein
MNRRILAVVAGLVLVFSGQVFSEEISMQVAPSIVNLDNLLHKLTIHADIDRSSLVDEELVLVLHGIAVLPVESIRDDYEGDLVAEFTWDSSALSDDDRNDLLESGEARFHLSGYTLAGDPFEGEDEVEVLGEGVVTDGGKGRH